MADRDDDLCTNGETHTPDWTSVARADVTATEAIVDVWCSVCGRSGGIELDPNDIQW